MNRHFQLQNNICWRVTRKCNRSCEFCLSKSDSSYIHPIISHENILLRLKEIGVEKIAYAGGEPTLHPAIGDIVQVGNRLGFSQVLTTNGDVFMRGIPSWVSQINYLRLSFYGMKSKHDSIMGDGHYLRLLDLAKSLDENYGLNVAANIMLTTLSVDDIGNIFKDLRGSNIKQVLLLTYIQTGDQNIDSKYIGSCSANIDNIKEIIKHYVGYFPQNIRIINFSKKSFYIVLDEKNQLTMPGDGNEDDFVMGNIMDDYLEHPTLGLTDAVNAIKSVWDEREKINAVIEY